MDKEKLIELVQKSQAGDRKAQESLIMEVQDPVFYQCRKILGNQQDAEDAAQDILIQMLGSLPSLKEPAAFWGWLNRSVANRCKNKLSREKKDQQIPEDEEGNSLLDAYENLDDQLVPDKALDNEETQRMMMELVDALPDAQRMCVMLYYYDEMPVKEIAAALGVSENTVKSRLNYARKSIKEGVEGYEKQGIKLYGVSPLPFLLYFLQKEAQTGGLSAVAKVAMAQSALSAGGGAVTASAGSVGGTAAVKAAAGAGAKATGLIGSKVAMGLAGVAIAGTVAGGAYLATRPAPPEPTPEPTPTPVAEVFVPLETATPSPASEPTPFPTPEVTPEPTPEPTPESIPTPVPTAEPVPAASPSPSPELKKSITYFCTRQKGCSTERSFSYVSEIFDKKLGMTQLQPSDFEFLSSDPSILVVDPVEGNSTTISAGTATYTARLKADPEMQYNEVVTVLDELDWHYTNPGPITLSSGESVKFDLYPTGFQRLAGVSSVSWTSENPNIATVERDFALYGTIYGISPGTTRITGEIGIYYTTVTGEERTDIDTVQIDVTVIGNEDGTVMLEDGSVQPD